MTLSGIADETVDALHYLRVVGARAYAR